MQINLNKPEIEVAIRHYITSQGISLKGKDVAVKFTYGRGDTGVSAVVTIEEVAAMPDFGADTKVETKLALVSSHGVTATVEPDYALPCAIQVVVEPSGYTDMVEPLPEPAPAKVTTSLFN
jgi:hypothetical protein